MRLIDADATIKEIKARNPDDVSYEDAWAITCIEHAPTIEPERKKGRWVKEHVDITDKEHPKSFRFHRCSACGHVAAPALFVGEKWLSYCPHCGAYMGGADE